MGGKEKNSNLSPVRRVASGDLPDIWVFLPVMSSQMDSTSPSSGGEYPQGPLPPEDAGQSQQPYRGFANEPVCSTVPSRKAKNATPMLQWGFLSMDLLPLSVLPCPASPEASLQQQWVVSVRSSHEGCGPAVCWKTCHQDTLIFHQHKQPHVEPPHLKNTGSEDRSAGRLWEICQRWLEWQSPGTLPWIFCNKTVCWVTCLMQFSLNFGPLKITVIPLCCKDSFLRCSLTWGAHHVCRLFVSWTSPKETSVTFCFT